MSPQSTHAPIAIPSLRGVQAVCNAVGTEGFGEAVFQFWRHFVPLHHHMCVVYRGGPGYECLFAGGTLVSTRLAWDLAHLYCTRYYRLDPTFERVIRYRAGDDVQVVHLDMKAVPSSQYKSVFWRRFGFGDRCSLSFARGDLIFCINLYRSNHIRPFTGPECGLIEEVGKVIAGLIYAHYHLAQQRPAPAGSPPAIVERYPVDRTRHDKLLSLSRNERVVLKLLLTGMSNEAIGLDQDISINTVKTYRKRLYKKLEVSTVNELHSRYGNLA